MNNKEYRELYKQIALANQRISRIEQKYGQESWAINKLYEKLDNKVIKGITLGGRIQLNRNMSKTQINAIRRATDEFLKSKTSTLTGIRQAKNNMIQGIKESLSDNKKHVEITDEDANKLYQILEDDNTRDTAEKVGASFLWKFLISAKEKNMNKNDFISTVKNHLDADRIDKDTRQDLIDIYNKYMKE